MPKKILVVEDDAKAAQVLGLRLKSAGYEVLVAHDGVEGLTLAKAHNPDLVVSDVWMPVGMGLALAYRLRQFAPNLPILFVTGQRRADVKKAVADFGGCRLVEKPYTPGELFLTVSQMLGEEAPAMPIQMDRRPRGASPSPQSAGRKKILIVEDDRKIGMSLSLRLKSAGYETLLAQDAVNGVSIAVKNQPDLLIMDISIPAGDGFQVAERVRALASRVLPVIFLTASKRPACRAKAAEMGAAAFFEKPFKSNELLAAVEAALV